MFATYVRVQDQLGNRYSVLEQEFDANPEAYELLDEPAADRTGEPLPAEMVEDVESPASEVPAEFADSATFEWEPPVAPPLGGVLSSQHVNPEGQTATDTKES